MRIGGSGGGRAPAEYRIHVLTRTTPCGPVQATELMAFLAAALAGLAAGVYLLVLHLFLRRAAPLPACAPDQRICAETYNLLLVLCGPLKRRHADAIRWHVCMTPKRTSKPDEPCLHFVCKPV